MALSATETKTKTKSKPKVSKPPKYAVFILNDDYTPWNFVVMTLTKIFNKTEEEANTLTSSVHNAGEGLCGIFSKEVAETKVSAATEFATLNKQPLRTAMRLID